MVSSLNTNYYTCLLPHPDLLHRNHLKVECERRGVGLEAEDVFLPIDELGISDETVFVPAFGLSVTFGVFEAIED
jgi:hypothetical protein